MLRAKRVPLMFIQIEISRGTQPGAADLAVSAVDGGAVAKAVVLRPHQPGAVHDRFVPTAVYAMNRVFSERSACRYR